MQARMVRPSEGVALSSRQLIDLLNYCTAVRFHSFDAFEGKPILEGLYCAAGKL